MLLSPAPTMRLLSWATTEVRGHRAASQHNTPKTTLTLELRTMELISGISKLDLKQDPVSVQDHGGQVCVGGSPVVGPLRPRRLDVLRKKPE